MTDLLGRGGAFLADQRTRHMSRTVTYQRGSDSVSVMATVGKTEGTVAREHGVAESYQVRDYLILAKDLILSGLPILPQAGDKIFEADIDAGFTYTFQVCPPPGSEPCYRESGGYHLTLRIHT